MNRTPNANPPDPNAFSCAARVWARIVRLLLLLTTVSLITMPLTQHIWTWDHFLQGGQDFELGGLAILTALCLVFLLARYFEQSVDLLLAASHLFSFIPACRLLGGAAQRERFPVFCGERVPSTVLSIYTLPLQI